MLVAPVVVLAPIPVVVMAVVPGVVRIGSELPLVVDKHPRPVPAGRRVLVARALVVERRGAGTGHIARRAAGAGLGAGARRQRRARGAADEGARDRAAAVAVIGGRANDRAQHAADHRAGDDVAAVVGADAIVLGPALG